MEKEILEIKEALTSLIKILSPSWKDYILELITILSFFISCFTLYKVWTINSRYRKRQKNNLFLAKLRDYQNLISDKSKELPSDFNKKVLSAFKNYTYYVKKKKEGELNKYIKRLEDDKIDKECIKDIIDNALIDFEEGVAQ